MGLGQNVWRYMKKKARRVGEHKKKHYSGEVDMEKSKFSKLVELFRNKNNEFAGLKKSSTKPSSEMLEETLENI